MPQITLEYTGNISQNIDFKKLFADLHKILAETGKIKIENCKSRAVKLTDFHIGNGGSENAFVHVDLRFLEGRPLDLKQEIGTQVLNALIEFYDRSVNEFELQITVEIKDIQQGAYFKFPAGSI